MNAIIWNRETFAACFPSEREDGPWLDHQWKSYRAKAAFISAAWEFDAETGVKQRSHIQPRNDYRDRDDACLWIDDDELEDLLIEANKRDDGFGSKSERALDGAPDAIAAYLDAAPMFHNRRADRYLAHAIVRAKAQFCRQEIADAKRMIKTVPWILVFYTVVPWAIARGAEALGMPNSWGPLDGWLRLIGAAWFLLWAVWAVFQGIKARALFVKTRLAATLYEEIANELRVLSFDAETIIARLRQAEAGTGIKLPSCVYTLLKR
jgi:hypothetical protein